MVDIVMVIELEVRCDDCPRRRADVLLLITSEDGWRTLHALRPVRFSAAETDRQIGQQLASAAAASTWIDPVPPLPQVGGKRRAGFENVFAAGREPIPVCCSAGHQKDATLHMLRRRVRTMPLGERAIYL